jgi:hypothetical protein
MGPTGIQQFITVQQDFAITIPDSSSRLFSASQSTSVPNSKMVNLYGYSHLNATGTGMLVATRGASVVRGTATYIANIDGFYRDSVFPASFTSTIYYMYQN